MNKPRNITKYKLGEVAKFSVDHPRGKRRYVDVYTEYWGENGVLEEHTQETITLPEAEAIRLTAITGNLDVLKPLAEKDPYGMVRALAHDWFVPGILGLLMRLPKDEWFKPPYALKYIAIRLDMRSGCCEFKDEMGNECLKDLMNLIEERKFTL